MPGRSAANGHQAPGAVHPARAQASPATAHAPAPRNATRRLGVLSLDHRRPLPAGLHRAAPRRARRHRHRLRRARAGVLRRPRHQRRGGCRPTTPGPTSTTAACASCSPSTASSTAGSRRAPPNATARSSATSRPSRANGPTDSATAQATPEPQRCRSGSSTTTPPGPTARSATGRPSAAFGTTRGTTARRPRKPFSHRLRPMFEDVDGAINLSAWERLGARASSGPGLFQEGRRSRYGT